MGLRSGWIAGTGPFFVDGQPDLATPDIGPFWPLEEWQEEIAHCDLLAKASAESAETFWAGTFWEINQPPPPAAPDVGRFADFTDQTAPGTDAWLLEISFWEINQPPPAQPDTGWLTLPDELARPQGGEDRWFAEGSTFEATEAPPPPPTLPWLGLFDVDQETAHRLIAERNLARQALEFLAWSTHTPEALPAFGWLTLGDDIIRPVPGGEFDAFGLFTVEIGPAAVYISEGDSALATGIEGDAGVLSGIEGDAGVLSGIEGG